MAHVELLSNHIIVALLWQCLATSKSKISILIPEGCLHILGDLTPFACLLLDIPANREPPKPQRGSLN